MQTHQFKEIVGKLAKYGYLPNGPVGVEQSSKEFEAALLLYQQNYAGELSRYTQRHHSRNAIPDGDAGPATIDLFDQPRCDCEDYRGGYPLQNIAQARWPDACKNELVTAYRFDRLNLSSEEIAKRWVGALSSWNQLINVTLTLENDQFNTARIYATDEHLSGSTLAWSYLANNSCGFRAQQKYNSSTNWNGQYFQAVTAHEIGHALGLPHLTSDRSALMYPYARQDVYLPQPSDVALAKRLGYRNAEKPQPKPPTGTVSGKLQLGGKSYTVTISGQDVDSGGGWLGLD